MNDKYEKMDKLEFSKYPAFDKYMREKINFILDENNNIIPANLMEWAQFMESPPDKRRVARDNVNGHLISTVFLGLDHGCPEIFAIEEDIKNYRPLILETMVFESEQGGNDIYCDRYSTWQEALEGHQKAIEWVKNGCKEEE